MELPSQHLRFASFSVLIVAQLLLLAYRAVGKGWWRRAKLRALLLGLSAALRRLVQRSAAPRDEADEAVRVKLLELRASTLHVWLDMVSLLNFVYCVMAILAFSVGLTGRIMSEAQDVWMMGTCAVALLMQFWPRIITHRWFALISCCAVPAWATTSIFPGVCSPQAYMLSTILSLVVLDAWSMTVLSRRHAGMGHALFVAGFIASYSGGDIGMRRYATVAIVAHAVSATAIAACIDLGAEDLIRFTRALQERQAAGNTLLRIFYDVVVETDLGLAVLDGLPQLRAFLRRGSGRVHEGTRLEEFFAAEEDVQVFKDHVRPEPRAQDTKAAGVMRAALRDGNGNGVNVEFFHLGFSDAVSRRHRCLIGIRELGDAAAEGRRRGEAAAAAAPGAEASGTAAAWVRFDSLCRNPSLMECSEAFRSKVGSLGPGTTLRDLLGSRRLDVLLRWLQTIVNLHLSESKEQEEEARRLNSFDVQLRVQGGRNAGRTHILAKCDLDLPSCRQSGDPEGGLPVILRFSDMQRVHVFSQSPPGGAASWSSGGSGRGGTPNQASGEHVGHVIAAERLGRPLSL
mmetsp:Transcript_41236/g.128151  ORF Transcript_41236/g.128151 Transcript_41236/m.128151 type:complete len:571 (-) Transcript_41236:103-1815(-)